MNGFGQLFGSRGTVHIRRGHKALSMINGDRNANSGAAFRLADAVNVPLQPLNVVPTPHDLASGRDPARVKIFDTTLRDGKQSPGCTMNTEENLLVVKQLAKLGVDIIEAGFPIASEGDFEAVTKISADVNDKFKLVGI